jgi:hypothetical protein
MELIVGELGVVKGSVLHTEIGRQAMNYGIRYSSLLGQLQL